MDLSIFRSQLNMRRASRAQQALTMGIIAILAGTTAWGDTPAGTGAKAAQADTVSLSESQLKSIKTGAAVARDFFIETAAIGNIDFNEDRSVPVYTPYQGRIIDAKANLGDPVSQGQILFTIESPDFIAAQSNLITAAATLAQTGSALQRAKHLYESKDIDQNDYETAVANLQSAEGALRAARNAVAVFGKSPTEIDHIVATRRVETALVVRSPLTGFVTARNAAPGLLVQPGNPPAPYAVADLSSMWMIANVPEADIAQLQRGQPVKVSVAAYPGRVFAGRITAIGSTVDPSSRRVMVRSEIKDPEHVLRSQMFATFTIQTGAPAHAPAVPQSGVVREGDGTMSVWVVGSDPHRFTRREVKVGHQQDGYDEIVEGLKPGETVAVDGAIFLSNMLYGGAS